MTEQLSEDFAAMQPLDQQIEEARARLRMAHHNWGIQVGVFEESIDLESPKAQQALHNATVAGNQLSRLLELRPKPEQSLAASGLGVVLKHFLGR